MADRSRDRDPIYSLHFSQAAAEASYLLRVTKEPLVAIRALSTIEVESKKVLAEMVEEARKGITPGFRSRRRWVSRVRRRRHESAEADGVACPGREARAERPRAGVPPGLAPGPAGARPARAARGLWSDALLRLSPAGRSEQVRTA